MRSSEHFVKACLLLISINGRYSAVHHGSFSSCLPRVTSNFDHSVSDLSTAASTQPSEGSPSLIVLPALVLLVFQLCSAEEKAFSSGCFGEHTAGGIQRSHSTVAAPCRSCQSWDFGLLREERTAESVRLSLLGCVERRRRRKQNTVGEPVAPTLLISVSENKPSPASASLWLH